MTERKVLNPLVCDIKLYFFDDVAAISTDRSSKCPCDMAITILPPVVEDLGPYHAESDESMSVDSDEDVEMSDVSRPLKRARLGNKKTGAGIVTPGEVVTDDPQWMR